MTLLVIGGGGREHALVWKLAHDLPGEDIVAAPGNPGIAELARCVDVKTNDIGALVALAERTRARLTIVGPEAPLAAGLVDAFRARGLAVFGPTQAAAEIETSKRFAKQLMTDAGVPTARASHHTDAASAKRAARDFGAPVVIKASGLAGGKGVIVAQTLDEADKAIDRMITAHAFGSAGDEILVEEFMEGEELSVFAITDGTRALTMLPAQDHKRLGDGDVGPNTGGMGAYAPVSLGTQALLARVEDEIFAPTLAAMRECERPFTGLLYAGLMLTRDGPKVVEFNCRFGDPETEAILPLMQSSLAELALAAAQGDLSGASPIAWAPYHAVTTVVAAGGYPDSPKLGDRIELPPADHEVLVFHAGTARDTAGHLVTSGGRVLAVTALGRSLADAQRVSAAYARNVAFDGRQYRSDIGWRELQRAGAS